MTRYTASHWGIYEIGQDASGAPTIGPLKGDPDPSEIGLHQLDPGLLKARVRQPSVRESWLKHGPGAAPHLRGREPFVEVEWDQALDLVAAEVDRVRRTHGNEAIFGGSYGWASAGRFHHAQSQVHRFLNAAGGYVRHTESYSLGAAHVIMPLIAGTMADLMAAHTSWDVMAEHTQLFVTFGGVPRKNSQSSPGLAGKHRVHEGLQAMGRAGTRFVNIGPCRDNLDTGTEVEWLDIPPHTDTALMLALAWQLQADGLHDRAFLDRCTVGFDRFLDYLTGQSDGVAKTPDWAAAICGLPSARITALAREMAASRTMLNIQWSLQRAHHGEQPFWMLMTLAAMLGQIGRPGGGFGVGYGPANTMGSRHRRMSGPSLDQFRNPVSAYIPCARLADMLLNPGAPFTHAGRHLTYPDIHMIYWAGGNPFHHHQDLNRLIRAWQKPASIVVHEPYWTATARFADVVLPVTTAMERNDIGYATQEGYFVAMRKVVEPFAGARDDYAIFSGLAQRLGLGERFTEGRDEMQWLRHLWDKGRETWAAQGLPLPDFDGFWQQGLVDLEFAAESQTMFAGFRADPAAHPLTTPTGKLEITSARIESFGLPGFAPHPVWQEPAEWLGAPVAARYPLHLLSDQPARKLHSQLDPGIHSARGKIRGREPVYMHPADAAARGIATGDIVEVFNARGRCLAAAVVTEDLRQGVARLSTGAWYDGRAEDGLEKHGNPNVLTRDMPASPLSQGCAAQTCLVDIRGPIENAPEVTAFAPPEMRRTMASGKT
jgi:biotin/methionine sulfoxide reductase